MKSRHLNFILVPVIVAVLVLLVAAVLGAGVQVLYLVFGELLPDPILTVVMLSYVTIVLSSLVWLSQGKDASIAIGKFSFLVVCTFWILDWLLSYFRIWPEYSIYLSLLVSPYLAMFLFPSTLHGVWETTKQKEVE